MGHRLVHSAACIVVLLWVFEGSMAQSQATGSNKAAARTAGDASKRGQPTARATAKKKKSKRSGSSARARAAVEDARRMMQSDDRGEVEAGIQSLGLLGTPDAVEPLAARIRDGLPPELLETAIVTLMALGEPEAGPVLYELTGHRRADVRLRAIEAVAATNPDGAERVLLSALSDADPRVRAAAAVGLGDIGASTNAIEKLFLALDRGNLEASSSIGKIMRPGEVPRLLQYLGQVPFRSLAPAFAQVLRRPDVDERSKLELVAQLQEVGTPEVRSYLGDVIGAGGESFSPALNRALLQAMQQISD